MAGGAPGGRAMVAMVASSAQQIFRRVLADACSSDFRPGPAGVGRDSSGASYSDVYTPSDGT